jgi:putative phosphoesterase
LQHWYRSLTEKEHPWTSQPRLRRGYFFGAILLRLFAAGDLDVTILARMAEFLVGVISDTHGLLRPEALAALQDCDLIIHAGDIGSPEILPKLREIAPVHAVRGNIDVQPWASKLPETAIVELAETFLYVLHDVNTLDLDPRAAGFAVIISGHSHIPRSELRKGVLYFNPGSAGPRRFRLPVSVGRLRVSGGKIQDELIALG